MSADARDRVKTICHRCNGTRQVGVTEVDQHGKRTTYLYGCAACREADSEGFIDATLAPGQRQALGLAFLREAVEEFEALAHGYGVSTVERKVQDADNAWWRAKLAAMGGDVRPDEDFADAWQLGYDAEPDEDARDTARLDWLEAWCEGLHFKQKHPGDMEPTVILDWFVGDGGDTGSTVGKTWRSAIDSAVAAASPAGDEEGT